MKYLFIPVGVWGWREYGDFPMQSGIMTDNKYYTEQSILRN